MNKNNKIQKSKGHLNLGAVQHDMRLSKRMFVKRMFAKS